MTTQEVNKVMGDFQLRERGALDDVANTARSLVPLLKDRQMAETAKDLEAKLWALDAVKQEQEQFVKANIHAVLECLMRMRDGGREES